MLQKGQSWTFTVTTAGSYGYYCTVHPDMTARIVVQPATTSAAPPHTHPGSDHHESGTGTGAATGAGTGAGTGTGHHTPTTGPAASAVSSKPPTPAKPPSAPPTSAPAAAAAPSAAGPAATPQALEPVASARRLDGLLVLAGVAVLCLLLVGSRSATREERDSP